MTDVIDAPATVRPIRHWIGGKPYDGGSGRSGPVFNPATGIGSIASCTDQEWRT